MDDLEIGDPEVGEWGEESRGAGIGGTERNKLCRSR